jgi:Holliday junction resolvasome RuvABC endonuclease subunit
MSKTLCRGTLAIDPGIQNTGWAYRTPGGFVHHGTIVTDPRDSVFFRIAQIIGTIDDKLKRAEVVVIEDFLGRLGRATVMLIGALGGYSAAALASRVFKVPNRKWAPEFAGEKDKEKVKKATMDKVVASGKRPGTQHEADAIGLLYWWEANNGGPKDGSAQLKLRYTSEEYRALGPFKRRRCYREGLKRRFHRAYQRLKRTSVAGYRNKRRGKVSA